jgi:hypothetical protein
VSIASSDTSDAANTRGVTLDCSMAKSLPGRRITLPVTLHDEKKFGVTFTWLPALRGELSCSISSIEFVGEQWVGVRLFGSHERRQLSVRARAWKAREADASFAFSASALTLLRDSTTSTVRPRSLRAETPRRPHARP